jgi:hypothetical protein
VSVAFMHPFVFFCDHPHRFRQTLLESLAVLADNLW